jgi:hypothetical protein
MIPGSNQPPYRTPCEGTVLCGSGPRYQNAKAADKNIPVWLFDAMVLNWDGCPGQPATINPYARPDGTYLGPDTDNCGGGGITYTQPTGPWTGICTDGSGHDEACSGTSTPAIGAPDEIFDLHTPPPIAWYQPLTLTAVQILEGGTGYTVGDGCGLTGGTPSDYSPPYWQSFSNNASLIVTSIGPGGSITGIAITDPGSYQVAPSSPNAMSSTVGTGASLALTFNHQAESVAQCKKIGFKNVQAMRQWHGQPGYFYPGGANATVENYTCPGDDDCSTTFYYGYNNSAPQTKYTTLEWSCTWDDPDTGTDTYSGSVSVNPESGILTVNSYDGGDGTAEAAATATYNMNIFSFDAVSQAYSVSSAAYNWLCSSAPGETQNTGCDGTGMASGCLDGDVFDPYSTASWSSSAGSFSGTVNTIYLSDTDTYYFNATLDVTDSSLSISISITPEDESTKTFTATVNLYDANSSSTILDDITTLLDEWDLTNDQVYPWRMDAATSMAPLVSRNEVPTNVSPANAIGYAAGWKDPNSYLYDGGILGAPMPAGYQGFFDFRWENYEVVGEIGGIPDYEIISWGSDAYYVYNLPRTVTQWTNVQQGIQFSGGAWIFYYCNNSTAANGDCFNPGAGCPAAPTAIMAQKWAETKVPLPSQNFFRPAANDRFVYDETQVYSILSTSGGPGSGTQINLGLTVDCDDASGIVATGLWGPYVNTDGKYYFWSVTGGGASVTLNAPVYLLPDNWQSASGDGSATDPGAIACFGKLRWSTGNPGTDPFPILGRAGVSAVAEYESNPDVTELTTDSLPNLALIQTGIGYDTINIYDKTMTLITDNQQVTRIDDTHFTVPVAASTLANAAWIQSYNAPAYYWDDQFPKGDYAYTDWKYWPRQIYEPDRINALYNTCNGAACGDTNTTGCSCFSCETPAANVFSAFTQEAGCVPFSPCNPSVLCISPNAEGFPNGVTYPFPTINLDEQYGSGWVAEFQQSMADLLWQPPHIPASQPCVTPTTAWTEDNGSCSANTDTASYYPHRPLVEARLTVPAGGPGLPSGITIGWVSPVTFPDSPDALFPPPSNGGGLSGNVPWGFWYNECDCIEADGRFAAIYENQVVTCD